MFSILVSAYGLGRIFDVPSVTTESGFFRSDAAGSGTPSIENWSSSDSLSSASWDSDKELTTANTGETAASGLLNDCSHWDNCRVISVANFTAGVLEALATYQQASVNSRYLLVVCLENSKTAVIFLPSCSVSSVSSSWKSTLINTLHMLETEGRTQAFVAVRKIADQPCSFNLIKTLLFLGFQRVLDDHPDFNMTNLLTDYKLLVTDLC